MGSNDIDGDSIRTYSWSKRHRRKQFGNINPISGSLAATMTRGPVQPPLTMGTLMALLLMTLRSLDQHLLTLYWTHWTLINETTAT